MPARRDPLRVVSVFTGAGGLDLGLKNAGLKTVAMCESWEPARRVLAAQFPAVHVAADIRNYSPSCDYDVLAAGFPCTDLSHAGGKAGIFGAQSGLVEHVFRIAGATSPKWVILENVPNLLHLHRGLGIRTVTQRLEGLGYRWAYRTLDSRFTGVPQRRHRVILAASQDSDPMRLLMAGNLQLSDTDTNGSDRAWGFYWTEGRTGLGLVEGATPTLKGGSTIGIPSAPAVWLPDNEAGAKFLLPSIEAGEALQGFPRGWTEAATHPDEPDTRWKLVGNAVTTGVGEWIGRRLLQHDDTEIQAHLAGPVPRSGGWPDAAVGGPGLTPTRVLATRWPELRKRQSLTSQVDGAWVPLSHRATLGFLTRIDQSNRELPSALAGDLEEHLAVAPRGPQPLADAIIKRLRSRRFAVGREVYVEAGIRHRPHVSIRSRMVAVDIRACFWGGCPDHQPANLASKARWVAKRDRVMARDRERVASLASRGWLVVVCWAHESPEAVTARVEAAVDARRRASLRPGGVIGEEVLSRGRLTAQTVTRTVAKACQDRTTQGIASVEVAAQRTA